MEARVDLSHSGQLEQGSSEWKKRKAKFPISGTAVGVIEGVNPYLRTPKWLGDAVRAIEGTFKDIGHIPAVRHGNTMEPWARKWYETESKVKVHEAGIGHHLEYEWLIQSPDGLIGLDGGIEIKCVMPHARMYSIWDDDKKHYLRQVQLMMEVWDLEWVDFLCFKCSNPDVPPIDTVVERVKREEGWLTRPLPGRLLPHPRKGTVQRIDLYYAWHQHVFNEHADEERRAFHVAEKEPEVFEVVTHDAFTELTRAVNRKTEIEAEISEQNAEIKALTKAIDEHKNTLADAFERSITDGHTKLRVIAKTPPVDFAKAFEALGGVTALEAKGYDLEDYRRTTNTRQITVLKETS